MRVRAAAQGVAVGCLSSVLLALAGVGDPDDRASGLIDPAYRTLRLEEPQDPSDDPFRFRPGLEEGRSRPGSAGPSPRSLETLLDAPLAAGRPSFFHAALEVPPLETARTLDRGTVYARLRSTHARSNWHEGEGFSARGEDDIDGTYREFASLLVSWSPLQTLELTARAVFAGWDEHHDRFELFNDSGDPIVSDEEKKILGLGATSRHLNLSVFGLGAKLQLWDAVDRGFDFALASYVKIPFGRSRDLTHAGTTDVALSGLARVPVGRGSFHFQLGATVPFGEQNLFNEREDVALAPFAFGGAGFTWRVAETVAVGIQVEGNTSAFRSVDFLRKHPASAVVGTRILWGPAVFEMGLGAGFDWSASYQWMGFASVGFVF